MTDLCLTRPRTFGDVIALARALAAVEPHRREDRAAHIMHVSETAWAHYRKTGRVHGNFGDGSVMSAALQIGETWRRTEPGPAREGSMHDHDWLACMSLALAAMKDALDLEDAREKEDEDYIASREDFALEGADLELMRRKEDDAA